jgi:hypothetical protein
VVNLNPESKVHYLVPTNNYKEIFMNKLARAYQDSGR